MALRIIHFVESLSTDAGSPGVSLPGLFRAFSERGIESHVVVSDVVSPHVGIAGAVLHHETVADELVAGADLIHLHGWGTSAGRRLAQLAQRAGKRFVVSPWGGLSEKGQRRGYWWSRIRRSLGRNALIRRAVAVTAVNTFEWNALQAACKNETLRMLPYGLAFEEYESTAGRMADLPSLPEGRCLLLLGPIHPAEGLVPLLTAFAEIGSDADGWFVAIAGAETGDWRKMLEAAVRRKGGSDRVVFADAPDVATQRAWLARASALAAPSLRVRCPVSLLQAIAAGVPVIASDRVAPFDFHDFIKCCAPHREGLKGALREVLSWADEERVARSAEARNAGRSRFDWSVLVDSYVELYKGLV